MAAVALSNSIQVCVQFVCKSWLTLWSLTESMTSIFYKSCASNKPDASAGHISSEISNSKPSDAKDLTVFRKVLR